MDLLIRGRTAAEIAGTVRELVSTSRLQPGDRLPPIRTLAAHLDVNRNTVAAAYRHLVDLGIAETDRRRGTSIRRLRRFPTDGAASTAGQLTDLASGNPDVALLPDLTAALNAISPQQSLYGSPPVDAGLRAWAVPWLAETADVPSTAELVVTHGAVDGIERVLNAHLIRGDLVAVEDPCFLASVQTLHVNGYRCQPVPVDEHGITPHGLDSALRGGARAVVVTNRAHNPTGASLSDQRAEELRTMLHRHPDVLVIEDDHFSAISGQPCRRVTPPATHRWAFIRSVSKFLGPDLRLALVACDPSTASSIGSQLGRTTWVSHLLQRLVLVLFTDPATGALLRHARASYADRRTLLTDALSAIGLQAHPPNPDGINAWIPVAGHAPTVVEALRGHGWLVRAGNDFSSSQNAHPAIRVTYSTITSVQATDFARTLAAVDGAR